MRLREPERGAGVAAVGLLQRLGPEAADRHHEVGVAAPHADASGSITTSVRQPPISADAPTLDAASSRRGVSAATNASWGTSTRPICFIRFLPSFWRSSSLRLRRDVTAVALGDDVLALRLHRLAGDDAPADRGLDRHVEQLARDQLAQLLGHAPAVVVRLVAGARSSRTRRPAPLLSSTSTFDEVRRAGSPAARSRGSRTRACATSAGRRSP